MTILSSFENLADGIKTEVFRNSRGYTVRVIDLDSGEILPSMAIMPNFEAAQIMARRLARGVEA